MKKVYAIMIAFLVAFFVASCAETDSNTQKADKNDKVSVDDNFVSNRDHNGETDNTEHSEPPEKETIATPNISGDFFASMGTGHLMGEDNFIITQQDGWYYYSFSSAWSAYIRKIPAGGGVEDIVTLYETSGALFDNLKRNDPRDNNDIYTIRGLQVVGEWIYWANTYGIYRIDINGESLQLLVQTNYNEGWGYGMYFWVDGEYIYYIDNMPTKQIDSSTFEWQHKLMRYDTENMTSEELFDTEKTDSIGAYIKLVKPDGSIFFLEERGTSYYDWYMWSDGTVKLLGRREYIPSNILLNEDGTIYYLKNEWMERDGWNYTTGFKLYELDQELNVVGAAIEIEYDPLMDPAPFGDPMVFNKTLYLRGMLRRYRSSGKMNTYVFKVNGNTYNCEMGSDSENAPTEFWLNNDVIKKNQTLTAPGDGYLYYLTEDDTLCRIQPDGSEWEDVSWLISE